MTIRRAIGRLFLRASGPIPGTGGYVVQDAWMALAPAGKTGDAATMDRAWQALGERAGHAGAGDVLAAMDAVADVAQGPDEAYRVAMHELTTAVYLFAKSPMGQLPYADG